MTDWEAVFTMGIKRFIILSQTVTAMLLCGALAASEVELGQLNRQFAEAYRVGDWPSASRYAREVVATKKDMYGESSLELIVSLTNLAFVQLENNEISAGSESAQEALSVLEFNNEENATQRLRLLLLAARADIEMRDAEGAAARLDEAYKLNKRVKPRDWLTEADIFAHRIEIAKLRKDVRDGNYATSKMLKAAEKHHGDEAVAMTYFHGRAGDWYRFSGQHRRERKQREYAEKLMIEHYGADDQRLARPLLDIARTYMMPGKGPEKAKAALERARALNFSDAAGSVLMEVEILAALADYHVIYADPQVAMELYSQAWERMAAHGQLGSNLANRYFSSPRRLYFDIPDTPADGGMGDDYFAEGHVTLDFTVGPDGRLVDIHVIEQEPRRMEERQFYVAARTARYRPRVVNGQVVATDNEQFRISYGWE
jgi:hypothetical protein